MEEINGINANPRTSTAHTVTLVDVCHAPPPLFRPNGQQRLHEQVLHRRVICRNKHAASRIAGTKMSSWVFHKRLRTKMYELNGSHSRMIIPRKYADNEKNRV